MDTCISHHHCCMKPAVFLDRDGTIVEERHYLHRPEEVAVFPGAAKALRRLMDEGYSLFMVTNQSGVGRGYFTIEDVERVHEHLLSELAKDGVKFAEIYTAPEAPDQPSRGRKPSPQFLFDARENFEIDLSASYMIGDKLIDLECGWNAGVRGSLLVRTGYGLKTEKEGRPELARAIIVDDLEAASEWIVGRG